MKDTLTQKKWQSRIAEISIFLLCTLLFLSCSSLKRINEFYSDNKMSAVPDFEKNLDLWNDKNISDYNFNTHFNAQGIYVAIPVLIEVRNGEAVSITATSIEQQKGIEPQYIIAKYERYKTVEKLFNLIKKETQDGAETRVKFNPEFGYPEEISFNYTLLHSNAWFSIKIDKFEIINPD